MHMKFLRTGSRMVVRNVRMEVIVANHQSANNQACMKGNTRMVKWDHAPCADEMTVRLGGRLENANRPAFFHLPRFTGRCSTCPRHRNGNQPHLLKYRIADIT